MKHLLDLTVVTFVLLLISPVILILMSLVLFGLGAPIFFIQSRPGLHGKPFRIVKFRTMTDDRDKNGILLEDEDRIKRIGP